MERQKASSGAFAMTLLKAATDESVLWSFNSSAFSLPKREPSASAGHGSFSPEDELVYSFAHSWSASKIGIDPFRRGYFADLSSVIRQEFFWSRNNLFLERGQTNFPVAICSHTSILLDEVISCFITRCHRSQRLQLFISSSEIPPIG